MTPLYIPGYERGFIAGNRAVACTAALEDRCRSIVVFGLVFPRRRLRLKHLNESLE